jgi:hypothetical protein
MLRGFSNLISPPAIRADRYGSSFRAASRAWMEAFDFKALKDNAEIPHPNATGQFAWNSTSTRRNLPVAMPYAI